MIGCNKGNSSEEICVNAYACADKNGDLEEPNLTQAWIAYKEFCGNTACEHFMEGEE